MESLRLSYGDWRARHSDRWSSSVPVRTNAQLTEVSRQVMRGLRRMGIRFVDRVPVRLVSQRAIEEAELDPRLTQGFTEFIEFRQPHRREVRAVFVRADLTPLELSAVIAHEATHVWIAQRRFPRLAPVLEEGACEFIAVNWLRRIGTPPAKQQIALRLLRADDVYGIGLRLLIAHAQDIGARTALRSLHASGRLPGMSSDLEEFVQFPATGQKCLDAESGLPPRTDSA